MNKPQLGEGGNVVMVEKLVADKGLYVRTVAVVRAVVHSVEDQLKAQSREFFKLGIAHAVALCDKKFHGYHTPLGL